MWGGCGDRVGGCLNQGAAVGLLLPVAFVFLVVEGGGSAAVTAFGVAVLRCLASVAYRQSVSTRPVWAASPGPRPSPQTDHSQCNIRADRGNCPFNCPFGGVLSTRPVDN